VLTVEEFARQLGIETCLEFDPASLVPEDRIRDFCLENKCGSYGSNYMCPPYVGSLEEIRAKLKKYSRGVLLQYTKSLDVREDREGVIQTKTDFHNKVLLIEEFFRGRGINQVWGLIGGNCGLCDTCRINMDEPCPYPDRARMSLEAIGIDVIKLLDKLGLDSEFHPDRITWTGCILYGGTPDIHLPGQ